MPDKGIDRLAQNLREALQEAVAERPDLAWKVSTEDGKTVLTISEEGPDGKVEVRFEPREGIDKRALTWGKQLTKIMLDSGPIINGKVATFRDAIGEEETARHEEDYPLIFAEWYIIFFALCLRNNLALAFRATPGDAEFVTSAKAGEVQKRAVIQSFDAIQNIEMSGLKEHMDALITQAAQDKRELLEQYIKAASPPPRLEQIAAHYDRLYPMWRDIRKLFADYGSTPAWVDMAKARAKSVGVELDDDLLARITGDVSTLDEGTLILMEKQGGDYAPATIALEHAARLRGAWKYQFHARTLYRRAQQSPAIPDREK